MLSAVTQKAGNRMHPVALQVCLNILRAGLIASRVDLSVLKFPGVIAAPLVIGTIGGSGGKFLQDGIQMACGSLQGKLQVHHRLSASLVRLMVNTQIPTVALTSL